VAEVKRAVRTARNREVEEAHSWFKAVPSGDPRWGRGPRPKIPSRFDRWWKENSQKVGKVGFDRAVTESGWGTAGEYPRGGPDKFIEFLDLGASRMAHASYQGVPLPTTKGGVKKVLKALLPPKATTRTTQFLAGYDGQVTFQGNLAIWSVSENNRAVEDARESPVGRAFFGALRRVEWTRGSGGTLWGNDEYNQEGYGEGGGNYVTAEYGP
jgi:hypothetical protein